MKTQLQLTTKRNFFSIFLSKLIIGLFLLLPGIKVNAQETCQVDFAWEADAANPMLIHFCGGGYFAHGSFSYTCVWDFGDGSFSPDSCIDHIYSLAGNYLVCQDAGMCVGGGLSCHDSLCRTITVGQSQATAIIEADRDNSLDIKYYPVPKNLTLNTNHPVQLRLTDSTGRIVNQIYLNEGERTIDLNILSEGLYFYSATSISGKMLKAGKIFLN
jgi:hypothetical protein